MAFSNLSPQVVQIQPAIPRSGGGLPLASVMLLGGLGVGGYFLYRHFFGKKR